MQGSDSRQDERWRRARHRSAEAKIKRVGQLALMLDLLALDADVRDPVLAATIRAASHIQLELLIESRQPLFEFIDQPLGKALGLGDGQLAEFRARASDCAAPE